MRNIRGQVLRFIVPLLCCLFAGRLYAATIPEQPPQYFPAEKLTLARTGMNYKEAEKFYIEEVANNLIDSFSGLIVPLMILIFPPALQADIFTGNSFIEGNFKNPAANRKLDETLAQEKNLSLPLLFEILRKLHEDIYKRSTLLTDNENQNHIIAALKKREKRLLEYLSATEMAVFHVRENEARADAHFYLTLGMIAATPILLSILFLSSSDVQDNSWHKPSHDLFDHNCAYLKSYFSANI